jgi:LacI family transcriptional regulator
MRRQGHLARYCGQVKALREAGLTIPGDIALVSYDDLPGADLFASPLTAFAQPSAELGKRDADAARSRRKPRVRHPHRAARPQPDAPPILWLPRTGSAR